jgi:glycerol-1-phosphate dehydrogenase [NAD(P)+]
VTAAAVARDLDGLRARLAGTEEADRLRPVGLGGVLLGSGVLDALPGVVGDLRGDGDVVVLADRRPMAGAAGEIKAAIVAALGARRVDVGGEDARPHADAATLDAARDGCAGAAVIVSVGSGTVADIGKATSARLDGTAHVVVQTAASVNGFADGESVLLVDGVKRTTSTRWPDRLLVDTDVLARAPVALNQAGLGDLLATYTAPADWLLARLVGQDGSYSPAVVALAREHVDAAVDAAEGIRAGDPAALEDLAGALTLSGVSMGVAGRTAPGSGMEHTVSHLLEMADPASEALHGAKVGILSILGALLWARVRAAIGRGALAGLRFPDAAAMEGHVRAAFAPVDPSGAMGEECWRDYARKLERWHASRAELEDLADRWPAFDAQAGALLAAPERLAGALRAAGAPVRLADLGIAAADARWALANCHLMRDRFTVADLAFGLGLWDDAAVDALLDEAATLGVGL